MTETPTDKNKGDEQKLNDTKRLVNRLFEKTMDNTDIPDNAKEHIVNLKTPYLSMALQTPNLFAFENHQARVFLNVVCQLSIDWKDIVDSGNAFIKKLENIVGRIQSLEKYDNKAFIQFQAEIEKSLVKLNKRAAIKQKRDLEKKIGQQKISRAKIDIDNLMSEKLSAFKNTPEFTKQLLLNEWNNVLVLLHMRSGLGSKEYQSKVLFVDMLLKLSSKQEKPENKKKDYEALLLKYQKGLSLVAFNKQEIKNKQEQLLHFIQTRNKPEIIKSMISPHELVKVSKLNQKTSNSSPNKSSIAVDKETVVHKTTKTKIKDNYDKTDSIKPKSSVTSPSKTKTQKPNTVKDLKTPLQSQIKPTPQAIPTDKKELEKNININFGRIVDSLKIGTWFEFVESNGKRVKAKLSWVSPISGKHLFVDAHGLKLSDKTIPELIEGLTIKTISIITKV